MNPKDAYFAPVCEVLEQQLEGTIAQSLPDIEDGGEII